MLQKADDRILMALQGPKAEAVLVEHFPEAADLTFMRCAYLQKVDEKIMLSRSGYTGEDGYELLPRVPLYQPDYVNKLDSYGGIDREYADVPKSLVTLWLTWAAMVG